MKKELTKAITLATTGVVVATSVLSPVAVYADTEIQESENQEVSGGLSSIEDIGVIASKIGSITEVNGVNYTNDLSVKILAASLREDVSVIKTSLYAVLDESNETLIGEISGGEGSISIGTFTGTLQLRYEMSDSQVLPQNLEEVCSDFNGITSVVRDENAPVFNTTTFDGTSQEVEGIQYYTGDGNVVVSFNDELSGVNKETWDVEGVDAFTVSDDGKSVSFPTNSLNDGTHKVTVSVEDMVGNVATKELQVLMFRGYLPVSISDIKGNYVTQGENTYIQEGESLEVTLGGYDKTRVKLIEVSTPKGIVDITESGKFSITDSGSYSLRVVDVLDKESTILLSDLSSELTQNIAYDNDAPAVESTSFSGTREDVENIGYVHTTDGVISFKLTDSIVGVDWDNVSVEGCDYEIKDGYVNVSTSDLKEGVTPISITMKDMLGNSNTFEFNILMLRKTPTVTGSKHGTVLTLNGVSFVLSDVEVTLEGHEQWGIQKIELLESGNVISTVENGKFTISKSGVYSVKVTDILGNSVECSLKDLFVGGIISSNVVFDNGAPVLSSKSFDGETKTVDGRTYYVSDGTITLLFEDKDSGVNKDTFSVDGANFSITEDGQGITVDTSSLSEGLSELTVSVSDNLGNTLKYEFSAYMHRTAPEITGNTHSNVVLEGSTVYSPGMVSVSLTGTDHEKVKYVELWKDGVKLSDIQNGSFAITTSGEYTVRVVDIVENAKVYRLEDLFTGLVSNVVLDTNKPVITQVSGFNGDLVQEGTKWYGTAPILEYTVEDVNIREIQITVNGDVKVNELSSDGKYVVNTEGYEGAVTVEVVATDVVGNEITDTFSYMSDFSAPTEVAATISENSIIKSGKVFFKETPSILVVAKDNGVGIKEYRLTGGKSETNTTGQFTLGDGSYFVEVIDKLGNVTEVIPVNTLLGLSSNEFIVDTENPEFATSIKTPDYIQVESDKYWYNSDVDYIAKFTDNIGINKATISINGNVVREFSTDNNEVTEVNLSVNTNEVPQSANGMYTIVVTVVDNAGRSSSKQEVIYIDRETPVVDEFVFTGKGYSEGVSINGSDRYGFFFDGGATCEICVSDGTVSSGLNKVYVTLEDVSGEIVNKELTVVNGVATIELPENFKGFISAYVVDKVGHTSDREKPDGVVTETSNYHINSVKLSIGMPKTNYKDISGIALYSGNTTATANIGCNMSGIRNIEWGIDSETKGTVTVDSNGTIGGDVSSVNATDKNIVLNLDKVLSLEGNANGLKVWVRVTDRSGSVSETSQVFSIDKDAPIISVSYDNTEEDVYYNKNRVATITVKERNFDPTKFVVGGSSGTLGNWSNDGDVWTNTITFNQDGDYKFTLNCTDMAGNVAKEFGSEAFTIDKTAPKMSVTWNSASATNDNFFNAERVATVTVEEHNFDASRVRLTGSGSLSAWKSNGDVHTATITFSDNGEYEFTISGDDKAGNAFETYNSGKFIVDITKPTISIEGVQNGISYKQDVAFTVTVNDSYIDVAKTSVTLTGRKKGNIALSTTLGDTQGVYKLSSIPEELDYDDVYTLRVVVTDKAGNISEESLSFSVNRFGSEYAFLSGDILGEYLNKAPEISITETNVDRLDTSKCKIVVLKDGKEYSVDSKYISITETGGDTDKYVYTYSVNKEAFSEDGKYVVQIYSTSEDGTTYNSVSQEYAFILDTEAPEVITSGIESGKKYHEYTKNFTIDIRDFSGVKSVKVTLNGKEVDWEKSNGVYSFNVKENDEKQVIEITVEDMAGNTSTVVVDDFLVTSDMFVYLINQTWFKFTLGGVFILLLLVIALIIKNRLDAKKDEETASKEYSDLYKESSSGSSSSSATPTSSSGKDLVEDLESTEESETQDMEESVVEDLDN